MAEGGDAAEPVSEGPVGAELGSGDGLERA